MLYYNFKKQVKVYVVIGTRQYLLDISEVSFSQDIEDLARETKTLQSQEMFAEAMVTEYKPANFQITFPALREADFQAIFDRALDYGTFDLYIDSKQEVFKIETCVITNASFIAVKARPLTLSISGEASKLTVEASSIIPGTPQARSSSRTYNKVSYVGAVLSSVEIASAYTSISIELQNQIKWLPFTILEACGPEPVLLYPLEFIVEKRILSGSISTYEQDEIRWNADTTLLIKIGQEVGSKVYGFEFDLSNVAFTSRIGTGQIYTRHYDWRLTQNPDSLSEIITYIVDYEDNARAILDYWGISILDSDNLPILDSF